MNHASAIVAKVGAKEISGIGLRKFSSKKKGERELDLE